MMQQHILRTSYCTVGVIHTWTMLPLTTLRSIGLHQWARRLPGGKGIRGIVTESIEPPMVSSVLEKPYTLVLLEDQGLYETSWQATLRESLPAKYGLHYCHQSLTALSSLDAALDEMSDDFATMPSIVLLARGPLASWMAQYYLESLPLAGLIMVDPISLESSSLALLEELRTRYAVDEATQELGLLDRIQSGAETRPLKLEAGVVPMLVLTSTNNLLLESARMTAERHSDVDSPFGEVLLETVDEAEDLSGRICDWIDEKL
jgi:hypothetical protein